MHKKNSILVIGGFDTGKTTYTVQLYCRLRVREFGLKNWKVPDAITALENPLVRLHEGLAVAHTPQDVYHEIVFPIEDSEKGTRTELVLPDYSGERITDILRQRRLFPKFRKRTLESAGWLFFVRLGHLRDERDILSRPIEGLIAARRDGSDTESNKEREAIWSDQAQLLELLQILLFVKKTDATTRVQSPALVVVLSCWDELGAVDITPFELLQERLPLLAQFISSRWQSDAVLILGLSSTERELDPEEKDEDYLERGPEKFGFVVLPDGTKSPDLTVPIRELMDRIS